MSLDAQLPPAARLRLVAALALGTGVFGATLAWCGAIANVGPGTNAYSLAFFGASPMQGDLGVACALAASVALPWLVARVAKPSHVAALAAASSLALGASLGTLVLHGWVGARVAPMERLDAWGATLCVVAALLRAAFALPLCLALRRGAALDAHDAADRVTLRASLWLAGALLESTLVVRLASPFFHGAAFAAFSVGMAALVALAALTGSASLARSVRWLARWRDVTRGAGWRLVAAEAWEGAPPTGAWFEGLGACDAVVVRTVTREGVAYRERDLEVAVARAPSDARRVTRGLALRASGAALLLVATAAVTAALVTDPRVREATTLSWRTSSPEVSRR